MGYHFGVQRVVLLIAILIAVLANHACRGESKLATIRPKTIFLWTQAPKRFTTEVEREKNKAREKLLEARGKCEELLMGVGLSSADVLRELEMLEFEDGESSKILVSEAVNEAYARAENVQGWTVQDLFSK